MRQQQQQQRRPPWHGRFLKGVGVLVLSFSAAHVVLTMHMLDSVLVLDRSMLLVLPSPTSTSKSIMDKVPINGIPQYNHSFPRWGPEGIDVQAVIDFMENEAPNQVMDRFNEIPQIPYIFDSKGVWVSKSIRNNKTPKHQIRHRVMPSEQALYRAWKHFMKSQQQQPIKHNRWPHLQRVLATTTTTTTTEGRDDDSGLPMIVWQADFQSCNRNNYNKYHHRDKKTKKNPPKAASTNYPNRQQQQQQDEEEGAIASSIPIFTTCAQVNCTHAFPLPTYETIELSQPTSKGWDAIFHQQSVQYPWHAKIRKLVWRGSLSGPLHNYQSPRSRIAMFAAQHNRPNSNNNNNNNNNNSNNLLDIGLHNIPKRHYNPQTNKTKRTVNLTKLGGLLPPIPQQDFAKYVAILDTDGNSWSSRFGSLLCTNSVVVKVEPHFVDSFYRYLQPWKHYVPVRYDLSDLLTQVEWILNPQNEETVLQIVAAANEFCKQHMTYQAISEDILDILDAYVAYLDLHDHDTHHHHHPSKSSFWFFSSNDKSESWRTIWKVAKARMLKDPALSMEKLSGRRNPGLLL